LNFNLRHEADYSLTFPMDPIHGPRLGLSLLLRLQPEAVNGKPIYLASRYDIPRGGGAGACRADWRAEGKADALLRLIPAESARLVIFNLTQQKELFVKTIGATQSGTIDYGSLQPQMTAEFVAGLVNRELREPDPADAVVFLGAAGQDRYRIPRGMIVAGASHPLFFYLQLGLPRTSGGPHPLGYTPPELVKALEKVRSDCLTSSQGGQRRRMR
jgi:hypothetical protein